ncbi:MAG: AAA family ATPase, partial [Brevundimonas sp.]
MPDHIDDEDDIDSFIEEITSDDDRRSALKSPDIAMPRIMLEQAMSVPELRRFVHEDGLTAIVRAPGADWVSPLLVAAKSIAQWSLALSATTTERKGKDNSSRDQAIRKGSKPSECVDRLVAAGKARHNGDGDLSDVPELDDLHGYGEAMEWARRLVADLDAWRRGDLEFSAIDRTAILASEPGLGKTTFVRSLAKTARVPLVATSVSSWFLNSTGHLDGVIKQIDQVFLSAAAQSPCIVLLDECEAVP